MSLSDIPWILIGVFVAAIGWLVVWLWRTRNQRWEQGPYVLAEDTHRGRIRSLWLKSFTRRDWQ